MTTSFACRKTTAPSCSSCSCVHHSVWSLFWGTSQRSKFLWNMTFWGKSAAPYGLTPWLLSHTLRLGSASHGQMLGHSGKSEGAGTRKICAWAGGGEDGFPNSSISFVPCSMTLPHLLWGNPIHLIFFLYVASAPCLGERSCGYMVGVGKTYS